MSESEAPPPGGEGQVAADATAGRLLREAREAYGLHIDTLAANLKVPVRKIQAMEDDRFDELPDAVFVRALASSMCRTLKIDPQPVLDRLPQTAQPRLAQDAEGINTPFRAPSDGPKPGAGLNQVSRPVVLTVVGLLLATAAVLFLPTSWRETPAPQVATVTQPALPAAATPAGTAPADPAAVPAAGASAPATGVAPGQPVPGAGAPPAPVPVAGVAPATSPAPAASASLAPAAGAASAAVAAASAASAPMRATGVVTFRTRGASWVQVTDANGTAVLRKLMAAGEEAGASGALPLSVTVGSVEQTEVQVRGKPFDLGPVARDNVARFEVR